VFISNKPTGTHLSRITGQTSRSINSHVVEAVDVAFAGVSHWAWQIYSNKTSQVWIWQVI
jgi:hypothetical protein